MLRSLASLASFTLLAAMAIGCAAAESPTGGGSEGGSGEGGDGVEPNCVPGQQIECSCAGGLDGVQSCNGQGTGYGICNCGHQGGSDEGGGGIGGADSCGDALCDEEENCHTCESDCGVCEPCTIAPSCDNAQIPPATLTHVPAFDNVMVPMSKEQILSRLQDRIAKGGIGVRLVAAALQAPRANEPAIAGALRATFADHPQLAARVLRSMEQAGMVRGSSIDLGDLDTPTPFGGEFPGGTVECGAPLLRVRAARIDVHEEDDDFANDIVYCALTSEAASASEIRVTPQTPNLDEGDSFTFPIEAGVFWGQQAPESPGGNLLLTYDCFEADSSDGYQSLIEGIGSAAEQIGGVAGSYGWIFTIVGAVAPVLSDAMALDGDDHLFNAQQTIGLDAQMDLTNGRFWSIRRSGTHLNSDWDWELRIEAWGCAEYGTL